MMGGDKAWIFPGQALPSWMERMKQGDSEEDCHYLLPRFCLHCVFA